MDATFQLLTLVLSGDLGQEVGPLTVIWLALWYRDSREDLCYSECEVVIDLVESVDGVLVHNVFFTFRQLELSGRNHVCLLGPGHRVVEQGSLVGVFLIISAIQ